MRTLRFAFRALAVAALSLTLAGGIASAAEAPKPAAGVRIDKVEVVVSVVGPVVLLMVGNRAIPIFVDATVADSILAALSGQKLPRPLSHDLMHSILKAYEGKVTRVAISLKGSTFHGDLTVDMAGVTRVFDSRSSDAIALAIHFGAPIWVSRELLESQGKDLDQPEVRRL